MSFFFGLGLRFSRRYIFTYLLPNMALNFVKHNVVMIKLIGTILTELIFIEYLFRYPQTTYGKGSTKVSDCEGPGLVVHLEKSNTY